MYETHVCIMSILEKLARNPLPAPIFGEIPLSGGNLLLLLALFLLRWLRQMIKGLDIKLSTKPPKGKRDHFSADLCCIDPILGTWTRDPVVKMPQKDCAIWPLVSGAKNYDLARVIFRPTLTNVFTRFLDFQIRLLAVPPNLLSVLGTLFRGCLKNYLGI